MLLLLDHETYPEIYKCGDNVVALRRGKKWRRKTSCVEDIRHYGGEQRQGTQRWSFLKRLDSTVEVMIFTFPWWNQAMYSLESDFNYFYSHKLISLNLLLVVLLFKCSITYKSYGSMEFKRYC